MNVSPSFSPPIKLMKPYFIILAIFFMLSMSTLSFLNPSISLLDLKTIGWTHLYMLGFVMLSIFSAMAQLAPVIVETKHNNVKIFKFLWILLTIGLLFMLIGFFIEIKYLLFGGGLVLVSMLIFATEFLLTLKTARRKTAITNAMKMSNFFLIIGILSGLSMALNFNGMLELNLDKIIKVHTFGLLVGFVILLIMGISTVLIPMFGLSKRVSDNDFLKSFVTITIGVCFMILSAFFTSNYFEKLSYLFTTIAILLYFYQLYKMIKSRKKVVHDIWAKSIYVGFISFFISFCLFILYMYNQNELILKLASFLLLVGFFGFLITANLYKIIPFLMWFHTYSPYIGEKPVPMLHELLDEKLANLQIIYSTLGLISVSLSIIFNNTKLYQSGVTFLVFGSVLFFISVHKMLKVKS